jgi:hypothetical protein
MLRTTTSNALKATRARTLSTRAGAGTKHRGTAGSRTALATGTGALASAVAYSFGAPTAHADAPNFYGNLKDAVTTAEEELEGAVAPADDWLRKSVNPDSELISLVWGSNKYACLIDVLDPHH